MVPSECLLREGIEAAGTGAADHQIGDIPADHQHDKDADPHGEDRSGGAGDRKEGRSGHDKGAPADHTAEGHCPDIHRRKISVESVSVLVHGILIPCRRKRAALMV